MITILTDEQLDRICENSKGICDCKCLQCEAFAANRRFHDGYTEADFDEDEG